MENVVNSRILEFQYKINYDFSVLVNFKFMRKMRNCDGELKNIEGFIKLLYQPRKVMKTASEWQNRIPLFVSQQRYFVNFLHQQIISIMKRQQAMD